jgi:chaperonin GroES
MARAKKVVKVSPENLQPLPGYVLVEPREAQKQTESGIYLPDTADEKPQEGLVLAVGSTWTTEQGAQIKAPVKKGDVVIYKKWGGNDVKIKDKEYQFLKFEDILAIVK